MSNHARIRAAVLYLGWLSLAPCGACNHKTPVPFKRATTDAGPSQDAAPLAAADAAKTANAGNAQGEAVTGYPEGTQQVVVNGTSIARATGQIYATIERDLDEDGEADVVLAGSDDAGHAVLELLEHGMAKARSQLALNPEPLGRGCRATGVQLALLGAQLGLASVDFQCEAGAVSLDAPPTTTLPGQAVPNGAAATPGAQPLDLPPPEPSAVLTQTHHFVFNLSLASRVLLRLCADWPADSPGVDSELLVTGSDVDGDQLEDVRVELQPRAARTGTATDDAPKPLQLTWLNRTTGLARDRQEPEASLQAFATEANRLLAKAPKDAVARASEALVLHRMLCKESGAARLWVDDARGIGCGASAAAGKALATIAIGQARQQRLLPALEARAGLDASAYAVDKKLREQVGSAIGTIRGDTSYQWRMGPALRPASAPSLHLPTLGFIDENSLLLRGSIAQSFDLSTRVSTPTGMSGSVLATDASRNFVLTDIVRDCDGLRVRIAPANRVIGGIVTGTFSSEPILQPAPGSDTTTCTRSSRPHSDHGGFVLLGVNVVGAVFAHGKHLWLLPLDAQGNATAFASELPANAPLPPILTPGALDPSARYIALATSEGVALIDRAQDSARLIRTPESCAGGRVSDAALSPSGQKLAMLCAGRVYVAEPAAESSNQLRPISEHP